MMYERRPIAQAGGGADSVILALLAERTGQRISSSRAWRVETALKPLLRELNLHNLDDLVLALVTARDAVLSDRVVDALLNQETSFFRDAGMFDLLGDVAAEMHEASPLRRVRVWSAGCAAGQEPLSIAMLLDERGLGSGNLDIVGTDVSAGAIQRASQARYSQFEIQRGLSVRRMIRWFESDGRDWTAIRALRCRIRYSRHNLVADAPPPGGFDIVLCRNLMLYLTPELRRDIFARLATALRSGGVLMLGASETVIGQTDLFVPHERWRGMYRRA